VTYRDDTEAAQARADALARQVEQLQRENAELRAHREVEAEPSPPPRRERRWGVVVVIASSLVFSLGGAAVAITMAVQSCSPHLEGSISASGGELGTWTMHPDGCESGERGQYRGVVLFEGDTETHGVGFVQPVGGETSLEINLESQPGRARKFTAAHCSQLDGTIERQNSSVNRITNIRGHLKFDCSWNGEHATGDVTFENCH